VTESDHPFFLEAVGDPERLARALKESRELFTLAEESAGIGVWDTDLATDMVFGTPTFFRLHGLPICATPVPNDVVRAVRHPEDAARVREGFRAAVAKGVDLYEVEYRIVRPTDGKVRWIFGRGKTRRDGHGKPVRYSGVDIDITERKQAEEQVRLLMRELNHRSNNYLTVVQALARLTATGAETRDFADRLGKRIANLAAAGNLLVSGKWQGVDIAALVRTQLAHVIADMGDRLTLSGPPLHLTAAAAQALGMALYELATNAVKYGAFASERGRVAVRWSLSIAPSEPIFEMTWSEQGGPPVTTPKSEGFGRTVIERMTSMAVGGTSTLQFDAGGITWTLICPADRVSERS
jgi:PAS domain S-box-containing protein